MDLWSIESWRFKDHLFNIELTSKSDTYAFRIFTRSTKRGVGIYTLYSFAEVKVFGDFARRYGSN